MSLTLRQLKVLEAIVESGSITEAANKVLVSQPAVSKSLAALEGHVGFKVFSRDKNKIALTEKGRALSLETKRLLGVVEDFDGIVDDIRNRGAQRIRVATTQMISSSAFLANALSEFCTAHPKVRLQIDAMSRQDVVRAATGDRADLVIGYLPFTSENVLTHEFGQSQMLAIAKKGMWLSDTTALTAQMIATTPMILLFDRSRLRRTVDQYLYSAGVTPMIRAEVATGAAMIQLAKAGAGISICDALSLASVDAQDLDVRPFDEDLVLEIGFIRRISGENTEYQNQLEATIKLHWDRLFTTLDSCGGGVPTSAYRR